MTTPFSTPRFPGAPNPTPRSTGKLPRAPIHNPYDKFTQPEFDAWINDITGALKRALGQEDVPQAPAHHADRTTPEDEAEGVEDSFADVRARRLAKGKERARDEDFEDEEHAPQHYGDENGWGETYSGPDYSSEAEEDAESSEEETSDERGPEVIDLLSDDEYAEGDEQDGDDDERQEVAGPAPAYDEEEDEGGSDEDVAGEEVAVDEEVEDGIVENDTAEHELEDDAGEEESDDEEAAYQGQYENDEGDVDEDPRSSPVPAHEVTEILDSDEEEAQEGPAVESPAIPARFRRKPGIIARVPIHADEDQLSEGVEEDGEQAEEEAEVLSPPIREEGDVDLDDPWRGPRTYAEDFYSGGDVPNDVLEGAGDPHALPTEDENDEPVGESGPPPDVHDPWEGPRTYAEDFYSGGDVVEGETPSHLTPRDEELLDIPGISFVPDESSRRPLHDHDIINVDGDDALTNERGPSPGMQPAAEDVQGDDGLEYVAQPQDAQEVIAETPRSPSPPSPTLRKQVDWNWPPAFPGRIATGPGHLADGEEGIVEISDDDDDVTPPEAGQPELPVRDAIPADDIPFGTAADASPASMPFSLGFDELYDMDAAGHSYAAFEPVANGVDFGDLPPSREEQDLHQETRDEAARHTEDISTGVRSTEEIVEDIGGAHEPVPTTAPEEEPSIEAFVEEVDEIEVEIPTVGEDVEVVSATGDDIEVAMSDYVVEEITTEGRLTEELESPTRIDEPPAEDAPTAMPPLAVNTSDTFLTEYPAPVSADPTVPDPASIAHTPASPVDSIASSSGDKEAPTSLPIHAGLLPAFRKMERAHSASGLFTPMTEGTSGSATPEQVDSNLPPPKVKDTVDHQAALELIEGEAVAPAPEIEVPPAVEELTARVVDETRTLGFPSTDEVRLGEEESTLSHVPESQEEAPAVASPPHDEPGYGREKSPASDADVDAEGELDPDYVLSEGDEDSAVAAVEAVIPVLSHVADDDLFAIKKDAEIPTEEVAADRDGTASLPSPVETDPATNEAAELEVTAETQPVSPEPAEVEPQDEARPLKRKRKSPPTGPSRVTRSRAAKTGSAPVVPKDQPAPKSRKSKGKRKQRASPETDDEEDAASVAHSLVSERSSAGSSALAQDLLLGNDSRATSRASSVVSNGLSMYSEASPTIARTIASNGNRPVVLPFIHDNGVLRHNHGGRAAIPVAPVAPPKRQPSPPPAPPSPRDSIASSRPPSPEPAPISAPPQTQPQPTPLRTSIVASTSTHSPATRSNCRYHTISLPIEEESEHRVYFAVPGCSLSNVELMQEEEIEDHGLTRTEELPTDITPIEDLKISPELLAILRQLTGVDLFREQEVIYLPRPGDQIVPKKRRSRPKYIQRESISARTLLTKDVFRAKQTPYKVPLSQVSASTSGGSASAPGKGSMSTSGGSFSESELSDLESEDERPTKRAKDSHPEPEPAPALEDEPVADADANASADGGGDTQPVEAEVKPSQDDEDQANGKTETAASAARRTQPRRGRKLKADVLAYKPEEEGESDGSNEGEDAEAPKKRKRAMKRGNKRARVEENEDAQAEGAAAAGRGATKTTAPRGESRCRGGGSWGDGSLRRARDHGKTVVIWGHFVRTCVLLIGLRYRTDLYHIILVHLTSHGKFYGSCDPQSPSQDLENL
ncbi:hypothetical protein LXA43DRAFT_225677 [Ganoderma leucocontextum]|nr:hypothetical protein LXA43DRAFT_225677 [Ganoderma leucocontextum]